MFVGSGEWRMKTGVEWNKCPRCGKDYGDPLENGYLVCTICGFSWGHHNEVGRGQVQLVYWSRVRTDYVKVPKGCLAVWEYKL